MKPCISDFISKVELIFPAVSLQNVNQVQNLASNPDILSTAFRERSVCYATPICDSMVNFCLRQYSFPLQDYAIMENYMTPFIHICSNFLFLSHIL
jgi:hypothetical protein